MTRSVNNHAQEILSIARPVRVSLIFIQRALRGSIQARKLCSQSLQTLPSGSTGKGVAGESWYSENQRACPCSIFLPTAQKQAHQEQNRCAKQGVNWSGYCRSGTPDHSPKRQCPL